MAAIHYTFSTACAAVAGAAVRRLARICRRDCVGMVLECRGSAVHDNRVECVQVPWHWINISLSVLLGERHARCVVAEKNMAEAYLCGGCKGGLVAAKDSRCSCTSQQPRAGAPSDRRLNPTSRPVTRIDPLFPRSLCSYLKADTRFFLILSGFYLSTSMSSQERLHKRSFHHCLYLERVASARSNLGRAWFLSATREGTSLARAS